MPLGGKPTTVLEGDFPLRSMMQCDNFFIHLFVYPYIPINSRIIEKALIWLWQTFYLNTNDFNQATVKGTPSIPQTYLSSSVWGLNLKVG